MIKKTTDKIEEKEDSRLYEFIGNHYHDSIIIGNYGDVRFVAEGVFNLSGILFCLYGSVELSVKGAGRVSFQGKCRKLIIHSDGYCNIDLTELSCDEIVCKSVKGDSVIAIGKAKRILEANLDNSAVIKLHGNPRIVNYSLRNNARIVHTRFVDEMRFTLDDFRV